MSGAKLFKDVQTTYGNCAVSSLQKDISDSLTAQRKSIVEPGEETAPVVAPHVVELNEAVNGQLGTQIKQVAISYRSIREGIMKKMQLKSREKYY